MERTGSSRARALALLTGGLLAGEASAAPTTSLENPLVAPVECATCHEFVNPFQIETEPPVSPMLVWRGTMMANAARDPVFWAGITVASQDAEADDSGLLTGATELCVRCHSPRAFLDGNGLATSQDELTFEQREGVECELCHRMVDDGVTEPGNAQYVLDDLLLGPELVPRRGPWAYDPDAPQEERPEHPTIQDPYTGTSRLCGTCHDVTTPRERVDADGTPMGRPFNEQRTYSEWLNSDLSEPGDGFSSCQGCHMPAVDDVAGCEDFYETGNPALLHETGGRRHDLAGANRFMLEIMRDLYGDGEVPYEHFDIAIERTEEVARSSAKIELTVPEAIDLREGFELGVRVINNTGHKLPTGYSEGRVAWLEVTATYEGTVIYSSGLWQDGVGRQEDEQLHTYEAHAEDAADGTAFHLLLNNRWVLDNRIPPKGLVQDVETDPVGDRYALQDDGTWPNFDEVTYTFPPISGIEDNTPFDANDGVDVSVRLLYLVNTEEYIEFLRDENVTNDNGEFVYGLFEEAGWATPVMLGKFGRKLQIYGLDGQPEVPAGTTTGGEVEPVDDDGSGGSGDPEADDEGDAGGCACSSTPGSWSGAWMVLLLFVRRRRQR